MKTFEKYPVHENFRPIDTIGVPHPYMITHHHVNYVADHFGGMLTKESIACYEGKKGKSMCGVKGCNLTHEEHKIALLIEVDVPEEKLQDVPELEEYIISCVPQAEKDGYAGFAFIQKKP